LNLFIDTAYCPYKKHLGRPMKFHVIQTFFSVFCDLSTTNGEKLDR